MNGFLELFGLAGRISVTGFVVIVILVFLSVWSLGVSLERLFVLARSLDRRQWTALRQVRAHRTGEGEGLPAG